MEDNLIGVVLGDYEVEQHIARGGMGDVYRGRQISLDRPVAIKVLPPELCADHDYIDRFLREARAAAHLNHPNIIQVFDAGISENIYFFVMELVDGKNLGQILREHGFIKEREALYIIQQVAEGLAFAHKIGVIHRDVKPENIMITSQGAIKICDLGLARWKPNEFESNMSSAGITMGTPNYISPEQIHGLKDIDARADVYSLGMTLYHMLAGRPAFAAATPSKIMAQHLADSIPPLKNFLPDISQDTMDLVDAMTAKNREDRIQDMTEAAEIIAEMIGHERASTPWRGLPVTTKPRHNRRSWVSRWNRFLTKANFIVIILLIALFLALIFLEYWKTRRAIFSGDDAQFHPVSPSVIERQKKTINEVPGKTGTEPVLLPILEPEPVKSLSISLSTSVLDHEPQSDDIKSVMKELDLQEGDPLASEKPAPLSESGDLPKGLPSQLQEETVAEDVRETPSAEGKILFERFKLKEPNFF